MEDKCPFCGEEGTHTYQDYDNHKKEYFEARFPFCYETEITRLKALVKEMGGILRCTCCPITGEINNKPIEIQWAKCPACEILNRPEVKKIMGGE